MDVHLVEQACPEQTTGDVRAQHPNFLVSGSFPGPPGCGFQALALVSAPGAASRTARISVRPGL